VRRTGYDWIDDIIGVSREGADGRLGGTALWAPNKEPAFNTRLFDDRVDVLVYRKEPIDSLEWHIRVTI